MNTSKMSFTAFGEFDYPSDTILYNIGFEMNGFTGKLERIGKNLEIDFDFTKETIEVTDAEFIQYYEKLESEIIFSDENPFDSKFFDEKLEALVLKILNPNS